MMNILAWIIIGFALLQLLTALANLIFQMKLRPWNSYSCSKISILIPARNEEKNLPPLLTDLQKMTYPNLEIIVFDDQSVDDTAGIIQKYVNSDNRFQIIRSNHLPEGWLGKNYACHQLAKKAIGEYFLFIDADVRISGNIIHKTLQRAKERRLDLLTIFPKQIIKSPGELTTVPLMNYILLSLLPLFLVHRTWIPSLAAANGQFMLFKASTYNRAKPHQIMKNSLVEDIQIARFFKKNKLKVACITGTDEITCRMYTGYRNALNGFSKNVIMFFGNSFLLAFLFWIVTTFGFLPVLLYLSSYMFILYLIMYIMIRVVISAASRQSWIKNILLIIPQQLSLGLILLKAVHNRLTKNYKWKERIISLQS